MITLPASYSDTHQHVTLKYLVEGRQALSSAEWKTALSGFDMLHQAVVETETENLTFREVYQRYVDGSFADPYITELLRLRDVAQEHQAVRARFARAIVRRLTETGLRHPEVRETNLLLAYCLYFWESFAAGYAFEVEIFRNLSASGIRFKAHDLRDRRTRISPYDLEILGLRGDVKTSFYFLYVERGQGFTKRLLHHTLLRSGSPAHVGCHATISSVGADRWRDNHKPISGGDAPFSATRSDRIGARFGRYR